MADTHDRGTSVWVYGSLMSARSVMASLPTPWVLGIQRQTVTGWRRSWNCLSARTFEVGSGMRVRRVVAGLVPAPGHTTEGVLLHIGDRGMPALRRREEAYDETTITEYVRQPAGPVVTFIPKRSRDRALTTGGLPLIVERRYFQTCVQGAREHGLGAAVVELTTSLDLELADAAGGARRMPM
jgi:hypothetical protein